MYINFNIIFCGQYSFEVDCIQFSCQNSQPTFSPVPGPDFALAIFMPTFLCLILGLFFGMDFVIAIVVPGGGRVTLNSMFTLSISERV